MSEQVTRVTFFEISGDGTVTLEIPEFVEAMKLKKLSGEVYYDDELGVVVVLTKAQKLSEDLFVNEEGSVFSIQNPKEEKPEGLVR